MLTVQSHLFLGLPLAAQLLPPFKATWPPEVPVGCLPGQALLAISSVCEMWCLQAAHFKSRTNFSSNLT